ncbi:hypothetical protein AWB82_05689 [Caballeronia glebae]|uniref:Uncharacterized protein n=1 Tax=Caballeronia glebae TaxID=1777143 RepID=A0A158CQP3_9BURK|nr:hypothetical protein [Caballeronia glebae]SAK84550.1 hypothetical protein AWB82_05689 [Caballeronia glebae]
MSFPEWGYSYNALYVPLSGGWHCALMPAREVQDVDRGWRMSYEERKQKRKEQTEQIEQDRQDFDRMFRVRTGRRHAHTCTEFREYVAFISRHLRVSSWDLLDGEGVTRALRAAVRDGHITPVIARNWQGGRRVFKRYAPQHWPTAGGGARTTSEVLNWREFAMLKKANGETGFGSHLIDSDLESVGNRTSRVSSAGSGGSFDWLSVIKAAGGAVAGAALDGADDASDVNPLLKSLGATDEGGSLFGSAQRFEYVPDDPSGDIDELAGMPFNGEPGAWISSMPGTMTQLRQYGPNGTPLTDFDLEAHHGNPNPHAHNWDGYRRDNGAPVSLLPW